MLQNFLAWQLKKKLAKDDTWQAFKGMLVKSGNNEATCNAILKEISKVTIVKQRDYIIRTGLTPNSMVMQTLVMKSCMECTVGLINDEVANDFFGNSVDK